MRTLLHLDVAPHRPAPTAVLTALSAACLSAWAQTPPQATEPARVEITGQRVISTASRLDEDLLRVPFLATVVDRVQMDAAGAKTLEDALRTVPGLQHGTQGNYFTRFETRGLRDTQDVLVLIDGVPLRVLQGNSDVTLLAPDLVERVEFIKGPASAVYGKNAIGGVVQFFLKPQSAGGSASLTAGSFGRKDGSVRQRWDMGTDAHVFAGAAYSHVDGFQRGTPRQQSAAVLSADVKLASNWTSGAQVYASKVNADRGSIIPLANGQPMFGLTQRGNFAIPGVYIEGEFVSLAWKNEVRLAPGLSVQHISSFARYDRLFQGGITIVPPPAAVTKGYSETDTADRGFFHDLALQHRLVGAAGWSSTTLLGVNLESGWQDQASPTFSNAPTYRGPNYDTPVSNVVNDPRGIRGAITASRFDQQVHSVYVQNRLERGVLGLTTGLRHDRFEQSLQRSDTPVVARQEAARTSPRVGLDWQLGAAAGGQHASFANWTEGFRPQAVALNTRNGVVVPALLMPERTRSLEAGVKGRADDDRWSYQLSLFQADKIDGQRSFRTGPDTFIFSNATSRVKGLESQVQWRLARDWSGYAHYTWQDARLLDFQTFTAAGAPSTNFAGYRVRMSARHLAGLGVTWSQGPWSLGASANHVGSRFLRDNVVNPQLLPSYTVANLVGTWRATPMLTLQAGIDNLGNAYYINDDLSAQEAGNAGAPRSAFLRVRLRY
jgi:outer membrane receptor protein involved in Fe transport